MIPPFRLYIHPIEAANQQAVQILEEAHSDAHQTKDHILSAGRDRLKQEVLQAQTELQTKLADIVAKGTEKILSRSVDMNDHKKFIDSLAKEIAG